MITKRQEWEASQAVQDAEDLKHEIRRLAKQLKLCRGMVAKAKQLGWVRRASPTLAVISEKINGEELP